MSPVDDALRQVETLIAEPEFKARLLSLLSRSGLASLPRAHVIHYRAETARSILSGGNTQSETRDALCQRFGISRRTAYRLIASALDLRQRRLF